MTIIRAINGVKNIASYTKLTKELKSQSGNSNLPLNVSVVLALKKVKIFELQYFNTYGENGLAISVLERMMKLPPSKTWGLLTSELISLFFFWIESLSKSSEKRRSDWWNFLKIILTLIDNLTTKDVAVRNMLVEKLGLPLMVLATNDELSMDQRFDVIKCLNVCSAAASRDVRAAMYQTHAPYFTKLAQYLATVDHYPLQVSILELLLRWLLRRQDRGAREVAATQWFPATLFSGATFGLFVARNFMDFFKDARDFLNTHNNVRGNIVSVVCKKIIIGSLSIINPSNRVQCWLDVNILYQSVSVSLDPRLTGGFRGGDLILIRDGVRNAVFSRESNEMILSIKLVEPPPLLGLPSKGDTTSLLFTINNNTDFGKFDEAMRKTYLDKYKCTCDDFDTIDSSTSTHENTDDGKCKKFSGSEEDTRLSSTYESRTLNKRRKRSGFITRSRQVSGLVSPSTASTTSLAQLHDKLAALPKFNYDKEPIGVSALPDLSIVAELSEPEDGASQATTYKLRYGVQQRVKPKFYRKSKTSPSDNEDQRYKTKKYISPAGSDFENNTSCLLEATIGSNNSIIHDTLERINKNSIVDLLVKEALNSKEKETFFDSGICENVKKTPNHADKVTSDTKTDKIDVAENTKCTIVSKSTSEESNIHAVNAETSKINANTDDSNSIIENSVNYVNVRRRTKKNKDDDALKPVFDANDIEEFFSQHCQENEQGQLVISPTLARKINESSSESSESFERYLISNVDNDVYKIKKPISDTVEPVVEPEVPLVVAIEKAIVEPVVETLINPQDIFDCLNSMIDKVCEDFDKCAKHIDKTDMVLSKGNSKSESKSPKKITAKTKPKTVVKKKNIKETTTPLSKKKRKLYSPKDEEYVQKPTDTNTVNKLTSELDDDEIISYDEYEKRVSAMTTPKSSIVNTPKATSYKEIEKDQKSTARQTRNRKSKVKKMPVLSPKTIKNNNLFDTLKVSITENDVKLADKKCSVKDIAIYNFTSDSDQEDFKKKQIEIKKRRSASTIQSTDSATSKKIRRKPKNDNTKTKSVYQTKPSKTAKRNKITKENSNNKTTKIVEDTIDVLNSLEDEKMREPVSDVLNTSFKQKDGNESITDLNEPNLNKPPEMQSAPEIELNIVDDEPILTKNKVIENKRRKRSQPKAKLEIRGGESPLPALIIETEHKQKDDEDAASSTSSNLVKRCAKYLQDGTMSDTNTSQNMFEINTRINYSPPEYHMDLEVSDNNISDISEKTPREKAVAKHQTPKPSQHSQNIKTSQRQNKQNEEVENAIELSYKSSDISISTIGNSPITAHGTHHEMPPSPENLNKRISPRNLELEKLSGSMKECYLQLRNELCENKSNKPNQRTKPTNPSIASIKSKSSIESVPTVRLERLSKDDMTKWLPSPKSSSIISSKTKVQQPVRRFSKIHDEFNIISSKKGQTQRASVISPINISLSDDDAEISNSTNLDFLMNIRRMFTENKSTSEKSVYNLRKQKSVEKSFQSVDSNSSLKQLSNNRKRKSNVENVFAEKKRKYEIKETMESGSQRSLRSVNKWIDKEVTSHNAERIERQREEHDKLAEKSYELKDRADLIAAKAKISRGEDIHATYMEYIHNILEKVDTTLISMNQETTRRSAELFVEMQYQKNSLQTQREELYKDMVRDLLKDIVVLVEKRYVGLQEKFEDLDQYFISQSKYKIAEFIKKDHKMKQELMAILLDDMQNIIQQMPNDK